ncbi:MAG: GNAT family N-acetyltransferase [Chloroflexota bacterium]|nr:GNAT family N-acetyltransferase [Chloroflexota bacterium]
MLGARLKISACERQHRSALLELARRSLWTHKHLDWHSAEQWLNREMGHVALAWQGDQLLGYIGLSQPIDGWSWIRLLGIRDGRMPGRVVRELWEAAEARCAAQGISNVLILMIANWLPAYLRERGFSHADDIITMSRIGGSPPAAPAMPLQIRAAHDEDMDSILRIDRLAFAPPWQLTESDMWQARRDASSLTAAELDGELIAYQLSTRQDNVGHLARLAVHPAYRRQGIASALLQRLIVDFKRQNLTELSVNTQLSNPASQRLYERHGFFRNGYDIELWRKQLT